MCDPKTPKPGIDDWYFDKVAAEVFNEDFHKETYHSSTHGYIKLSFTARRLLANLRFAIQNAIRGQDYSFNDKAVAKARGDLAVYMHQMEDRLKVNAAPSPFISKPSASVFTSSQLCEELAKRKDWGVLAQYIPSEALLTSLKHRLGL